MNALSLSEIFSGLLKILTISRFWEPRIFFWIIQRKGVLKSKIFPNPDVTGQQGWNLSSQKNLENPP